MRQIRVNTRVQVFKVSDDGSHIDLWWEAGDYTLEEIANPLHPHGQNFLVRQGVTPLEGATKNYLLDSPWTTVLQ